MRYFTLGLALSFLACGGTPAPKPTKTSAQPKTVTGPFAADTHLLWTPDAKTLIVDGHLQLDVAAGTFAPVHNGAKGSQPFSAPKGLLARLDGHELTLLSTPAKTVTIPTWLGGSATDRQNFAYFIDNTRIYVHQISAKLEKAACRIYSVTSGEWKTPGSDCLDPQSVVIDALRAGPGYTVVSHSGSSVYLIRYDPRRGQQLILKLNAREAQPTITFTTDGIAARVASPCAQPKGICDSQITLYDVELTGGKVTKIADMPAGALPAPVGDSVAHIKNGAVCVGPTQGPMKCYAP